MEKLLSVSLRLQRVWIPEEVVSHQHETLSKATGILMAELKRLGFGVTENLLHALNSTSPAFQGQVLEKLRDVMGVNKNWVPLVKGWDIPTNESEKDHWLTHIYNLFQVKDCVKLQCGHTIPSNTFPVERYTGCPFCKTPFITGEIEQFGQGSNSKILDLWTAEDAKAYLVDLLQSKTALDATQVESLKVLLTEFPYPEVKPAIKETMMLVLDAFAENGKPEAAQEFFQSPVDIMRYLWYKHTGLLQIVEPKTLINRAGKVNKHMYTPIDKAIAAKIAKKKELELHYNRKQCFVVASWINGLALSPESICEQMHAKRAMWIRFIRALRLAEFSKRAGFEKLKIVLDKFYNQQYTVWQGELNTSRMKFDQSRTFDLLKQRPGLFARSLFANMLWFGAKETLAAFEQVIDQVPARLMFTLSMYADIYFKAGGDRVVKPIAGVAKRIPVNQMLTLYEAHQLEEMKKDVRTLCLATMQGRYAAIPNKAKSIYIDEMLFNIPMSIGDRSETVQDISGALQGMKFPVEGNTVRLFMQWGVGLPAQHLDMDLSSLIVYENHTEPCSYYQLTATGCKHSGDFVMIPEKKGTAEYIEIDTTVLRKHKAKYVAFSCNAFSNGSLSPNMTVGWMNSSHPMKISRETGVAYDPSCVQHQVRITQSLNKGLVFGVLDVEDNCVVWLEMPFDGQTIASIDYAMIQATMQKLKSKISIGDVLLAKATAQNLRIADASEADEIYTIDWARNTAAVTKLLPD